MKVLDIMVDSETISTEPNACILSLGACVFDPTTAEIGPTFYAKLNHEQGLLAGLHQSKDTMEWWAKQSEAAQKHAFDLSGAEDYGDALLRFQKYLIAVRDAIPTKKIRFWANDPDFDGVILMSSFKAHKLLPPWQYWEHRSVRTIKDIGAEFCGANVKGVLPDRQGTYHNALDDAVHQARVVSKIWTLLGNLQKN